MNKNYKVTYSISDEHLRLAQEIAIFLVQEQKRIQREQQNKKDKKDKEKEDKGISTELSKLITYLTYKIKQRKPARFFIYLEELLESGETIGHSKTTPLYYESIHKICKQHLVLYADKPAVIVQILAWSQRLMDYIQNVNLNFEPDILPTEQIEPIVEEVPNRVDNPEVVKSVKKEAAKKLESPQSPQPSKPVPPQAIKPKPIKPENYKS